MIEMTARLVGLVLILATAALPVSAETVLLSETQKKEAAARGETDELMTVKFKTAVAALRERIDGLSIAYNQLARRLHPACERLIQR